MNEIRELRVLGETALDDLSKPLNSLVSRWGSEWCVDAASRFAVTYIRVVTAADVGMAWSPLDATGPGAWIALVEGSQGLAALLADMPGLGDDGMATAVCERALEDLNTTLVESASTATTLEHALSPLAGAVVVELRIGDEAVRLLIAPEIASRHAPRGTSAAVLELASPRDVIGNEPVELIVSLPLGSVTLDDLRDLRPGDCLATGTPLDAPFEISLQARGTIAHCRLGRRESRRAVVIEKRK